MPELQLLKVKCYSGHTYAQRPESFFWQNKEHKISRIEKEWLEPGKRFFKVVTEDEKVFELCYNEAQDQWRLINQRRGGNMKQIFEALEKDARMTPEQISTMTGVPVADVKKAIKKAEQDRAILRYKAIIDWTKLGEEEVLALVEVKVVPQRNVGFDAIAERVYRFPQARSVYLASGTYDLAVLVAGKTMQEVAVFVSEKLATLEAVQGTVTHFILKKYKEDGEVFDSGGEVKRLPVTP